MKRLGCATILFILAAATLAKALLTNPLTTTWAMFGFWIMCLFIGCVAIEKAFKEMGIK